MIWRLFRPKPIFVVTLPTPPESKEEFDSIKEILTKELWDSYKVVLTVDKHKIHIDTKLLK